jgi:protocatechuate 3,4-dioxygenase alpha subunit
MAARSPSQTIGPFFHEALRWDSGGQVRFPTNGEPVVLHGRIYDGAGDPVGDAMVETWQKLPKGCKPAPAAGASNPYAFGRVETNKDGTFRIETSMPQGEAPFLDVTIFARGLLKPLRTRVYLAPRDKVRADAQLAKLADSPRLDTLIAKPGEKGEYRWEVRLQGEGETVFFAT